MKRSYLGVLILGVVLGIAVALPITALASSWPSFFGGDKGVAGMMSSRMYQQMMGLDSEDAGSAKSNKGTDKRQPHITHEEMHQMMDAVHGEGTSQRMHEAMGEDAEMMMDQCVAMMNMMQGMVGNGNGSSMMDMMKGMMGR